MPFLVAIADLIHPLYSRGPSIVRYSAKRNFTALLRDPALVCSWPVRPTGLLMHRTLWKSRVPVSDEMRARVSDKRDRLKSINRSVLETR